MREDASAPRQTGRRGKRCLPLRSVSPSETPLKRSGSPLGKDPVLNFAYRLLSYRGRSEKELRQRLILKGFDELAVDTVMTRLTANGFLDDRKLAFSLKRYAEESKHLGIVGTKRFLRERGIPREIIDEAVDNVDETDAAHRVARKMMRSSSSYPPEKTMRRLYNALARKGFTAGTIRKTLGRFIRKEEG